VITVTKWRAKDGTTVETIKLTLVPSRPHGEVAGYVPVPNHDGEWFVAVEPYGHLLGYFPAVAELAKTVDISELEEVA
jgi:hypothetical protein